MNDTIKTVIEAGRIAAAPFLSFDLDTALGTAYYQACEFLDNYETEGGDDLEDLIVGAYVGGFMGAWDRAHLAADR
jgi:hypothetical protein